MIFLLLSLWIMRCGSKEEDYKKLYRKVYIRVLCFKKKNQSLIRGGGNVKKNDG